MRSAKEIALDLLEDTARFTARYLEPLLIVLLRIAKIVLLAGAAVLMLWAVKWLWVHLPV